MNNFDIFVKSTMVGAGFCMGVIIGLFIFFIIASVFFIIGDMTKKGNK